MGLGPPPSFERCNLMKTFYSDGVEITIPDIGATTVDGRVRLRIEEGDYEGIEFEISNIRMDDKDETLMWYDLDTFPDGHLDNIKPIVDNFILSVMIDKIERLKNEDPTTE